MLILNNIVASGEWMWEMLFFMRCIGRLPSAKKKAYTKPIQKAFKKTSKKNEDVDSQCFPSVFHWISSGKRAFCKGPGNRTGCSRGPEPTKRLSESIFSLHVHVILRPLQKLSINEIHVKIDVFLSGFGVQFWTCNVCKSMLFNQLFWFVVQFPSLGLDITYMKMMNVFL